MRTRRSRQRRRATKKKTNRLRKLRIARRRIQSAQARVPLPNTLLGGSSHHSGKTQAKKTGAAAAPPHGLLLLLRQSGEQGQQDAPAMAPAPMGGRAGGEPGRTYHGRGDRRPPRTHQRSERPALLSVRFFSTHSPPSFWQCGRNPHAGSPPAPSRTSASA